MEFSIQEGKETRITLVGKLDFSRAPVLMEEIALLKGKDISSIQFDCKALTYLSSAGIRVIIFAQQKIAPNMTIIMKDVSQDVAEVLDICGLADFVEFTTSK